MTSPERFAYDEGEGDRSLGFKAVSFGATVRTWQHWIQAAQRLDGTLFVNAERSGVERWFEVQANDVGRLLFKLQTPDQCWPCSEGTAIPAGTLI